MKDKLYDLLVKAFSKKDRNTYIELSEHINSEIDNLNKEVEALNKEKEKALKNFSSSLMSRAKFLFSACAIAIGYFGCSLLFMKKPFMSMHINSPIASMIDALVVIILVSLIILTIFYKHICNQVISDIDNSLKVTHTQIDKYSLFYTFIGSQIDLMMYKDIYQNIYDIQEYLKNNDAAGYDSFINAANNLKVDLSKYVKKS